MTFFEGVD